MSNQLPLIALSVRQPWAWAIVAGHKRIENRSLGSIRAGNMEIGRIAVHAASGLKEKEFRWGHWRLHKHGVVCPRPDELVRSAIIGAVDVVEITTESDSEWFGGEAGLVLENAEMCEPIPCTGSLGYFEWKAGGTLAKPKPWMLQYDLPGADQQTLPLFDNLAPSFRDVPVRPGRRSKG